MLSNHYNEIFEELKDAIVTDERVLSDCVELDIEFPVREHKCTHCGETTTRIKDYRVQRVEAEPIRQDKKLVFVYRKRRYFCPHCRKSFDEDTRLVARYQRVTISLAQRILKQCRDLVSLSTIAKNVNVTATRIGRMLGRIHFAPQPLSEVISIDEFRGNAGGQRFQVSIMDPVNRCLIDILPTKDVRFFENDVKKRWSAEKRASVRSVVMDLSSQFRASIRKLFPNATIVADRFHVSRLAHYALEKVRVRAQKELSDEHRKRTKHSRTLLLKNSAYLDYQQEQALQVIFARHDDLGPAFGLKEMFFEAYGADDREQAERLFNLFSYAAKRVEENYGIKEFSSVVKTLEDWWEPIMAFFDTGYTNGYIEGCNNKIKALKRVAFGFRNFEMFRTRIFLLFI